MKFKPHIIASLELPKELQETININSWVDLIRLAYRIVGYASTINTNEITKERIKFEISLPYDKDNSDLIYMVIVESVGIIGFSDTKELIENRISDCEQQYGKNGANCMALPSDCLKCNKNKTYKGIED